MDRKNTFTAVAVLCLLGLIASLITVPAGDGTAAFPWHRPVFVIDQDDAQPVAKRDGLIGLTKRTIANAENITEAVKAGISAAGKVIDRTEARSETPQVSVDAVREAVKEAAPPSDVPIPQATSGGNPNTNGEWGYPIIGGGGWSPIPLPQPRPRSRSESSPADLPVSDAKTDTDLSLVMVTSASCPPCHAMKPILARIKRPWKTRLVDFDDPQAKQWLEVYSIKAVPYYVTYRGHEALEVAQGAMSAEELDGWLERLERGESSPQGSRFVRSWAQDSLQRVDREYLQMRMTPGSCGMLGCMAHGGGWITETVAENPEVAKPAGHWETRAIGGCPGGNCPSGGCPTGGSTQQVWVADPDPTGTVPWTQDGGGYRRGIFGGRRGRR